MNKIIKDIIYINEKKAFLTYIHKKQLKSIIEKANTNKELSNKDYYNMKQMKFRIKMFLQSNRSSMNSRLNRCIRESVTTPSKDIA